jgi:phosphatidylglycerophosphatase A
VNGIYLAVATGLGTGLMRPAPGTWGTLVGIPLAYFLSRLGPTGYAIFTIVLFIFGVKASSYAEEYFEKADARAIVIDEVVGYLVTMFLLPATFWNLVWAFFLFRAADVAKPWPARAIDRAKAGGLGVMADDVFAAIYANLGVHLLAWLGWFGCALN